MFEDLDHARRILSDILLAQTLAQAQAKRGDTDRDMGIIGIGDTITLTLTIEQYLMLTEVLNEGCEVDDDEAVENGNEDEYVTVESLIRVLKEGVKGKRH
jgi:hypothetical protein